MFPYIFYFASYLIYVFLVMEKHEDYRQEHILDPTVEIPAGFKLFETIWNIELILFSLFFIAQERRQFKKRGLAYFTDVWNYADVLPPLIIILVCIVDFFATEDLEHKNVANFRYTMQAVASFFMWIKIFYFLRIFRQTGFFVNMLLKVISEITTFFILYILILCSFGCSFFIMTPSEGGGIFYNFNYAYLLSLGEFDMEWDNYRVPITMQMFFLLATLLVLVVMLNLLIAIVSTVYENVIETQQEANDFERANLISDVEQFVETAPRGRRWLDSRQVATCKPNEYLIKAER